MKKTKEEVEKILYSIDFSRGRARAVWQKARPRLNTRADEPFADELPVGEPRVDEPRVDAARVDELSFGELDEVAGGARKPERDDGAKDKK